MPFPKSLEELSENPEKFGMPTFQQYTKSPEKWLGKGELREWLDSIDNGDHALRCKHKYFVENYRVESLEHAERIILDMGLNLMNDFVVDPQVRPDDRGGFYTEVRFRSKDSIEKRKNW